MECPNCQEKFDKVTADSQTILYCKNCGSSFFEENGINRVTLSTAQDFANGKREDMISGAPKFCPKDHATLLSIHDDETMPHDVTLLRCPTCRGVFAYPDDLIRFKLAQNAKVEYFKAWHKPLPSLQAVLVLSFAAFMVIAAVAGFNLLRTPTSQLIQAEEVVQNLGVFRSGPYTFVTFRTEEPYKSGIILRNISTGEFYSQAISVKPQQIHTLQLTDIGANDQVLYSIILTDEKGRTITTIEERLPRER